MRKFIEFELVEPKGGGFNDYNVVGSVAVDIEDLSVVERRESNRKSMCIMLKNGHTYRVAYSYDELLVNVKKISKTL